MRMCDIAVYGPMDMPFSNGQVRRVSGMFSSLVSDHAKVLNAGHSRVCLSAVMIVCT